MLKIIDKNYSNTQGNMTGQMDNVKVKSDKDHSREWEHQVIFCGYYK